MIANTNKSNTLSLGQLINKHPELPVIPLICNSFADYYTLYADYTARCIEISFISIYCDYNFNGRKRICYL